MSETELPSSAESSPIEPSPIEPSSAELSAAETSAALAVDPRLAVHYTIARAFAEADRLEDAASVVLGGLADAFGWQAAVLWVVEPKARSARLRAAAVHAPARELEAWAEDARARQFKRGDGLPGHVWATGEATWIRDTDTDTHFARREVARQVGLRHGFLFPIWVRGEVAAVIELFGGDVRDLDAAQTAFLESVAHQLGGFMERIAARQAVAVSEARKSGILSAAYDAVVASDADGRIVEFNAAAERMFGVQREEVLGRTVGEVMVPEDLRTAHRTGMLRYARTGEARIMNRRVRTWAQRADRTRLPIELTVTESSHDGSPMYTAFIRDISREREAEIARERFLEILSHELRTPVTAIYGGAKVLGRGDLDDVARRAYLDDMADEADRLYRLIEDLIVLARAERGALSLQLEPVRLERIAERVIGQFAARSPEIKFDLVVAGYAPPVAADETYLQQLLRNMLSNAVKYGGTGGEIEVRIEHDEPESIVRVLDRGVGIDAADINHLFEMDFRSPLSEGLAHGSGIGLFVSRWLVRGMGGRIWAAQREGGGSEFGFALRTIDTGLAEPDAFAPRDASGYVPLG